MLVNTSLIFAGDGSEPVPVMSYSVTNTGFRPVTVQSVGWETGWLRRFGPSWLRKQYAIQKTDFHLSPGLPRTLQPGESVTLMSDGVHVFGAGQYDNLFTRVLPWLGKRRTRILGTVHTTLRTVRAAPAPDLVENLLGGREDKDRALADKTARAHRLRHQ